MELTTPQKIAVWILPLIFALGFREAMHGYMAYLLGDPTGKLNQRLSLNPTKHLDLFGSILIPLALLAFGGFLFGWGKPVPMDSRYFKHPRRDLALVAAGGLLANLFMILFWGAIAHFGMYYLGLDYAWVSIPLIYMGKIGILLNVALAVLNCIPLPPLDGGRILVAVLPYKLAAEFSKLEPYSFFIVLFIIIAFASFIMEPIQNISASINHLFKID